MSSGFVENVDRVPAVLAELAGGRTPVPVWRNDLGGLTFRLGDGPDAEYVKWCPAHPEWDAMAEAERMRWARN